MGAHIVGMVQLRPLPATARYAGEPVTAIIDSAVAEASLLAEAGFTGVQVQNMGDSPGTRRVGHETVAYMTSACIEIRRAHPELQLSLLVNWDTEASLAVAHACGADFVRAEHTWIGAAVTAWGIAEACCYEATRFRTRIGSGTPIYADVREPHAVPLVEQPIERLAQASVVDGAADGLFVTGQSVEESLDWVQRVRSAVPGVPIWLGGGASAENVADLVGVVDGMVVARGIKHGSTANPIDPQLAHAFMAAARAAR